jgi:hypothetical protein
MDSKGRKEFFEYSDSSKMQASYIRAEDLASMCRIGNVRSHSNLMALPSRLKKSADTFTGPNKLVCTGVDEHFDDFWIVHFHGTGQGS